jgi:hypothetical protein
MTNPKPTPLSPAANAVDEAARRAWVTQDAPRPIAAAAFLALEEQLAQDKPAPMSSDLEVAVLTERIRMLRKISAIAAELEGANAIPLPQAGEVE